MRARRATPSGWLAFFAHLEDGWAPMPARRALPLAMTLAVSLALACGDDAEGSGASEGASEGGSSSGDASASATSSAGATSSATSTSTSTTGMSSWTGTTSGGATSSTSGDPSTSSDTTTTSGADTTTSGGDTTGFATVGDGLSFAAEVFPIIKARCSCHKVSYPDAPTTYAALVYKPSMGVPDLTLVVPFDVDASYLLHKLKNTQGQVGGLGVQMPPSNPLSGAELAIFDTWVDEGAAP